MTKTTDTARAAGKAEILASFQELRESILAMPDTGHVLWNPETKLAVAFTDDDPAQPKILGLPFAKIFTDGERYQRVPCAHLQNAIADGAGRPFKLFNIHNAKSAALAAVDGAIATVEAVTW